MDVTISTHNGSTVCREHNVRNAVYVRSQEHIKQGGLFEIWHDETVREAYDRIFEAEYQRWNSTQRPERQIYPDYYTKILNDKSGRKGKRKDNQQGKKPVYEMIIGVYCKSENEVMSTDLARSILKEFVDGWQERNPQLELIGAYFHADEEGKDPHVHIDYIPVAECERGMRIQNSLDRAFRQMGFEGSGINKTAQVAWERRENEVLERICRSWEMEVLHPQRGKGAEHLNTEQYKAQKQLEEVQEKLAQTMRDYETIKAERDQALQERDGIMQERDQALQELTYTKHDLCAVNQELKANKQENNRLKAKLHRMTERLEEVGEIIKAIWDHIRGLKSREAQVLARDAEKSYEAVNDLIEDMEKNEENDWELDL
jgi:hypothetical protein